MKFPTVGSSAMKFGILAVVVLFHCGDASFLAPRQVGLAAKAHSITHDEKDMPVTNHDKNAGGNYNKGSPLFKKQESRKASGKTTVDTKPPPKQAAQLTDGAVVQVTVPPTEKALDFNRWWKIRGGWTGHIHLGLWAFVETFVFFMCVALIWMKCAGGRCRRGYDERKNTAMGFAYGLFSMDHCCGHHSSVCLCSWCCGPLRLADTYTKEPFPMIGNFWSALIIITCLAGFSQLTFGITGLLMTGLCIYYRQQLRKQYGLEAGGLKTCCLDSLVWIFCPFCAMAQEARQVEFVKKPNDPVK